MSALTDRLLRGTWPQPNLQVFLSQTLFGGASLPDSPLPQDLGETASWRHVRGQPLGTGRPIVGGAASALTPVTSFSS